MPANPKSAGSPRSLALLALFIAVLALVSTCSGSTSHSGRAEAHFRNIVQRGVLRVGTTGDFYPFSLRDTKTNAYRGYDIEVARQLASDLGVRLEFVQTSWPGLVAGMVSNKYDVALGGITMTLDRLKSVSFSDTYVAIGLVPLIRKEDAGKFKRWQDLDREGVVIAVDLGASSQMTAQALFRKAKIVAVEPPARSYQEVQTHRADAAVNDVLSYTRAAQNNPTLMVLRPDAPMGLTNNGIMVAQGDQVLLNWLNAWVRERRATGFFDRLNAKWNIPAAKVSPATAGAE